MTGEILLKGIVIGFSIAAPVGPIGVLCIRRTLAESRLCGLASGLGAATADAFYGSISAFGLTLLSSFLVHQQVWLRPAGGVFLCWLGFRTLLARPATAGALAAGGGGRRKLIGAYASTFLLTLTNPMTIVAFMVIFAGLGAADAKGGATAGLLVLGVFLGSSLWWCILSGAVGALRSRIGPRELVWVNRTAGVIITGFGLWALGGVWR